MNWFNLTWRFILKISNVHNEYLFNEKNEVKRLSIYKMSNNESF